MRGSVGFLAREVPLSPVAAAAVGEAARRLGERLLRMSDERLSALRGVSAEGVFVVIGESDSLPWVDGIDYLGQDSDAPRLLLPTALRPDVPADLFERAILARLPGVSGPVAVLASPRRVVPVGSARRIERAVLERELR